jgi:hypothetical protein
MATTARQMKQLRELLQSPALRKQVRAARDQSVVVKKVMAAGAKQGFTFSERWLKEAFDDVKLVRRPVALSERELLALAGRGGLAAAGSENKLCHTESCGGNHAGCC